jgi:N-carbamoyl-L-amino-acid hydrolase
MLTINPERLLANLHRVADFGRYKSGVNRPTFSPQDVAARDWLVERMTEAGLDARIDGVGNVFGKSRATGRKLLVGSHSESQVNAGWLDGILGVIYGLEVAYAIAESPHAAQIGVDVGAWSDEECHYLQFLGSRSFCDDLDEAEIAAAKNKDDGTPLPEALQRAGYLGRPREIMDPSRYVGYLEAHIEQGDYLDNAGLQVGIVTSLVGLWQYRLRFSGEQNHAGTTRMATRKDAGAALVKLIGEINRTFPEISGPRSVWTVGSIELDPGAPSIVPGGGVMMFQFRDEALEQLQKFEAQLYSLVEQSNTHSPCPCVVEVVDRAMPKRMADSFQNELEAAAEQWSPGRHVRLPSMAAHDAQIMAKRLPAGMLFVPSINGISHHWLENTAEEDIVAGCRVFASGIGSILLR